MLIGYSNKQQGKVLNKLPLTILITISMLTGCTSRQALNSTCDFATGTAGSYIDRKIDNDDDRNDAAHGSMEQDILVGVFSILTGALNRAIATDKKEADCP